MCHNFDDEKKEHLKIEENKRKKQSEIALMLMKRNNWENARKKKRNLCEIALMMNKKNI